MAKHTVPFFDAGDLSLLAQHGGQPYDTNNPTDKATGELIKAVWEKTIYWHKLILEQLPEYNGHIRRRWLIRGTKFEHYTWTRIFKKGDNSKDIFFTVGIDGPSNSLIYKLDYKNEGSSNLSPDQQKICRQLIKGSPAEWVGISSSEMKHYDWDKLVDETISFIRQYEGLYDKAIDEVWNTAQNKLARITYNGRGWQEPSGAYGKSNSKGSFEAQHGYGCEEWIFDMEKIIVGYRYAFLEPIHKFYKQYKGKTFNITLYTIDADSGKRFWIGEIKNLEVIDAQEAANVFDSYKQNGWLREMKEQTEAVNGKWQSFQPHESLNLFNIRFKPADALFYGQPIEVPAGNPLYNISRYVLLNNTPDYHLTNIKERIFDFENYSCTPPSTPQPPITRHYEREAKVVEFRNLHRRISDGLHKRFAKQYGHDNVKTNVPVSYGGEVDMIRKTPDGLIFYEIKTYNSLRVSIRVALGQILEYAMWPDNCHAVKFIILTQPCADTETVKKYFQNLRKNLGINIYYQSYDVDKDELSPEM